MPLGICLDTAHAFEAGYEIHTAEGLDRTIEELDRVVGLRHLYVVHANDSKTPFGSRVDRHEHIGKGAIGVDAFRRILTHPRLSSRAPEGLPGRVFILETPIDVPGDDRRNVCARFGNWPALMRSRRPIPRMDLACCARRVLPFRLYRRRRHIYGKWRRRSRHEKAFALKLNLRSARLRRSARRKVPKHNLKPKGSGPWPSMIPNP